MLKGYNDNDWFGNGAGVGPNKTLAVSAINANNAAGTYILWLYFTMLLALPAKIVGFNQNMVTKL